MELVPTLLTTAWLAPLGGFLFNLLGWSARDRTSRLPGYVSLGCIATSFACVGSAVILRNPSARETGASPSIITGTYFGFAPFGNDPFALGYFLDGTTLGIFLVVACVAGCVHLFALAYMSDELVETHVDHEAGDVRRAGRSDRFFAFLSLFCFAMFGLVISGTFLQVFLFWELVGASSYFLIGFYHERAEARSASSTAFVVNRVGDAGFLIGVASLTAAGLGVFPAFQPAGVAMPLQTVAALGIFAGCVGKSAQFPLQAWLPRAMAGPTPVSALVHSATMVAAGVYLMARVVEFGLMTPFAEAVVTAVSLVTIVIGAVCACVQTDLKAVLAYSTISQLGYMLLAIGCGDPEAGMFHLVTHAFFKSLLFLAAGAVIHACHHEQELPRLGGLRKTMPLTAAAMLVGTLAISGLAVPTFGLTEGGWLGLSGFYSKDTILEAAHHAADERHAAWIFWVPLVSAGVTAFYMVRLWFGTFGGRTRSEAAEHAREVGWTMLGPLAVLSLLAMAAGWFGLGPHHDGHHAGGHTEGLDVPTLGVIAAFAGAGIATAFYGFGGWKADRVLDLLGPLRPVLTWGLGFDCLYRKAFVAPSRACGALLGGVDRGVLDGLLHGAARAGLAVASFDRWFDERVVDGAVDGVAATARSFGRAAAAPQGGSLRRYVLYLAVGVTGAALVVTFWLR